MNTHIGIGLLAVFVSAQALQGQTANRSDAPAAPNRKELLFVVGYLPGPGILDRGDVAIKKHLEDRGFAITLKSGTDSRTADAEGKVLVIVSSTIDSDSVGTKFRDVAVPVIDSEHAIFDDMQMTAPKYWRDFGFDKEKTSVTIIDPKHPLSAGLTGTVKMTVVPETIVWAIPPETAIKVAAHAGDPKKIAIFASDTGMQMYGMKAPARRVGFCFYRDIPANASREGWALFDAAVDWAIESCPARESASPGNTADQPAAKKSARLSLSWEKIKEPVGGSSESALGRDFVIIRGTHLPGKQVQVRYLEAFCRANSTNTDWAKTQIGHKTELVSAGSDRQSLKLRSTLEDGVIVTHEIKATNDEVQFLLTVHNPTRNLSAAHWGQPCIRGVESFTGGGLKGYLRQCFVFLDGKLTRMPTQPWAEKALCTPGQVYCPKHVSRRDVNPHPLSELVPSNGLIGCFSHDNEMILATAWEPYQDLFLGIVACVHADFHIGGLQPGETKKMRGKIYLLKSGVDELLRRYERDFPEHVAKKNP